MIIWNTFVLTAYYTYLKSWKLRSYGLEAILNSICRQCVLLYEPSADRHDSNATRGTGDAAGVITSLRPHNRTTLTLTNYFPVCTNVLTISWGAHTRDQSRNESCADTNFTDARRILPALRSNFLWLGFFLQVKIILNLF